MSNKEPFLHIRARYDLSVEAIAAAAQVRAEDVYYLEAGVPYPQETLTLVLAALSRLTGENYSLDNVGSIYPLSVPGGASSATSVRAKEGHV